MKPIEPFAAGCLLLVMVFVLFFAISRIGAPGIDSADATETTYSGALVTGDVEFSVTHYDPALGGTNGRNCGGAVADVCSNSSSPTGYVGNYNGKQVSTAVIAVPQDINDRYGKVHPDKIPVPLIHRKVLEQARIIIPGYNDSQPALVGDHFATSITKPNRLDLSCSKVKWQGVLDYWNKNKLVLGSQSGLNGGIRIKGKIEGTVIR